MKYNFRLTYNQQLRTSAWMRKKYEILSRDNFVCSNCLADNLECKLNVHHIAYIKGRQAWEYNDYMLVTLCDNCHKEQHDNNNLSKPLEIYKWILKLVTPKHK